MLYGLDVTDKECNSKHIHQIFKERIKLFLEKSVSGQLHTFRNLTLTQILERPWVSFLDICIIYHKDIVCNHC